MVKAVEEGRVTVYIGNYFEACLAGCQELAPTPMPTATSTATASSTPSLTPSLTPTVTRTPTVTPSPTVTASPTVTKTPTITSTPTQTSTVTKTTTVTPTTTVTKTPTVTQSPTVTPTPTQTPTVTKAATVTVTPTITKTPTVTNTPTKTGTPTSTSTVTKTPTVTITPTRTATPTNTSAVSPTPTPTVVSFPSTGILDNFNRSNGGIGSGWSGAPSGYTISSNKLDVGNGGDIYWNTNAFGASQEAYIKLTTVAPSGGEQDLVLKSQCNYSYTCGMLEVLYDAPNQRVQVVTYESSQDWVQHGVDISVTFANGDIFGARATANGQVSVYKNGVLQATRDISSWPYYDDGGYIGVWFVSASAAIGDDFGGGTMPSGSLMGVHVRASLVKAAQRGNGMRKAHLLQIPPSGQVWRSYYFAGATRIAMRMQANGVGDKVFYLLTDHLGSTAITVNENGSKQAELRYAPWGTTRYAWGETPTDYKYTGQREDSYINLHWYGSRWYDDSLGRFAQPDSIIPNPGNALDWDRYSYVRNNPVKYADPDGHRPDDGCRTEGCSYGTEERRVDIFRQNNWLQSLAQTNVMSDLESLAQLTDYAADLSGNCKECFIEDLGAVVTGMSNGGSARYEMMHRIDPERYPYDEYYQNASKLGQSGYAEIFQDPNPELTGGNQGRHFWFYVQVGYESGAMVGAITNIAHETIIPFTTAGKSLQDLSLGYEGIALGISLQHGSIVPSDVGDYTRDTLSPGSASASFWEWYWPAAINALNQYPPH